MDPITVVALAASIVQLIDATTKALKYLNDVKDALRDRATLAREVTSLLPLLTDLRYKVEEASSTHDPWFAGVRTLGVEGGPLDQLKDTMVDLTKKLKPETGAKNICKRLARTLVWTIDKGQINNILSKIERLKTRVSLALQGDHFKLSLAIKGDLAEVKNNVHQSTKGVAELQKGQISQESRRIIAWLSPLDFPTKQTDFIRRREEGTGEWLLKADIFRNWVDGTGGTLLCPGIPGAGKTVLTSTVVDYLEQSFQKEDVAVAYVYCNYKEQGVQTAVNLIASLLQQVVQRNPVISEKIISTYQRYLGKKTRPPLDEWSDLLQIEARRFSKVLIAIDALDECPESNDTRATFLAEIRKLQPNIHLLVTSRHIPTIEREFGSAAHIEIRASDRDIRRYLESRIRGGSRLARNVEGDPALQELIVNAITERADGMQLHAESLAKKLNRRDVRTALTKLPRELNDTYDEAVRRIRSQDEEVRVANRVLYWISYALGPLTVRKIQHALAVEPGDLDIDRDAVLHRDVLASRRDRGLGSRAAVSVVVGLNIARNSNKKVTISVWRPKVINKHSRLDIQVRRVVNCRPFRDEEGNTVPGKLSLSFSDFAPAKYFASITGPIPTFEISYSNLSGYLYAAEQAAAAEAENKGKHPLKRAQPGRRVRRM
ncbi:MAG: hypothetical protein M1840_004231 [Geoglossum simile]|nr:MAG: hypothetical protein M1840_004231 [Geoglossum simile]